MYHFRGYHQDLPFMEGWNSNKEHQKIQNKYLIVTEFLFVKDKTNNHNARDQTPASVFRTILVTTRTYPT